LPKVLQIETTRKNALLMVALVSALALTQWFLGFESVPAAAAPVPGSIVVAQAPPPKCGQDAQHPCPKGPAQGQPTPKAPAQPQQQQQQQQKPQAQPQPTPPPAPALKQQAQPQPPPPPPPPGPALKQQVLPKQLEQKPVGQDQHQQEQHQQGQKIVPGGQQPQQGQKVVPGGPQPAQVVPGGPQPQQGQKLVPGGQQPQQGQKVVPGGPQPAQVVPGGPQPQQGQKVVPGGPQPAQVVPGGPQPQLGQKVVPGGAAPAQTFKRVVPAPGQPQPGQAAAGPTFGNVQDLRAQRKEHTEAGGRVVIEEPDHRQIVREGGQAFVRHDENERLFQFGAGRRERRGDGMYAIIDRPDGDQIITVTDDDGRLVRRFRRERDGREFILIDNRRPRGGPIFLDLPVPVIGIPQDQYIVDTAVAPEPFIYQTLEAPPLVPIERPYSLDEIRYNVALRDRMRRIDVDTITFDLGSWEVSPDQVARLQLVAQAIQDSVARNPNEVFLIEGHTDAVGNDVDNLSLSDRRAETVASILTESFQIPPENLTSQGYGSHYLKIPTPEANRQNRRVTVRRITPLLNGPNG
jgi:outer membrane protein OmpA-like peptidoglycan-associated protein